MPAYNISTGLPDLPTGLTDEQAAILSPLYRAISALAQQVSVLTATVQYTPAEMAVINQFVSVVHGKERKIYFKALQAMPYGALISLTTSAGKLAANLADYSPTAKPAHAICDMPAGLAIGEYGIGLLMGGLSLGVGGSVLGSTYYLSAAGGMQLAVPVAPNLIQKVALGLGSAGVLLQIALP